MTTPKRITMDDGQEYELVPVETKEKKGFTYSRWVNVYGAPYMAMLRETFDSKESADLAADNVAKWDGIKRIDCIHIKNEYEVE